MINTANECQRRDCEYYSTFTDTCDFTLVNSRRRPCPIEGCTEYRGRGERRAWMKFWPFAANKRDGEIEMYVPERAAAPEEPRGVIAACGHEVCGGEYIYEWEDGELLCPDCLEDRFADLTTREKAAMCGLDSTLVCFSAEDADDA